MRVPFSYLDRQFADVEPYLDDIRQLVASGDFTLGDALGRFERRFAAMCGVEHALGVASGTDALMLALRAAGVGPGDEVITSANTFIATIGSIASIDAVPVLVDSDPGYVIDADKIEAAITSRTRAIVPVHYTGNVADMPAIMAIAERHGLAVIEDCCQAIGATLDGRPVASFGLAGCYSLHPLKNINVWGDGGMVATSSAELAERIGLLRNHGLVNRDEAVIFGMNSRLDTLQALIGNRLIDQVEQITSRRIEIASRLDQALAELGGGIDVPPRRPGVRHVFHLYVVLADRRDELLAHLIKAGVEAKIHYPIPVHLQPAARHLGHGPGSFPIAEDYARRAITLPAHQHLTDDEVAHAIECVRSFYGTGGA